MDLGHSGLSQALSGLTFRAYPVRDRSHDYYIEFGDVEVEDVEIEVVEAPAISKKPLNRAKINDHSAKRVDEFTFLKRDAEGNILYCMYCRKYGSTDKKYGKGYDAPLLG